MAVYLLRRLPAGLLPRLRARAAADGTTLDDALLAFLTSYADGTDRVASGRKGGRARAAALTSEQRSAIARTAALRRWADKTLLINILKEDR